MSKKVLTVTFTNTVNYGAILQATALQRVLLDHGYDTKLLNYNVKHDGLKSRPVSKRFLSFVWSLIKGYLGHTKRKNKTSHFLSLHNSFTSPINDKKNLLKLNDNFDVFIVGSDQVWNPKIIGNDTSYLLDFVSGDKTKLSYAASFGLNVLPSAFEDTVKEKLKSFQAVSVREQQARNILDQLSIDSTLVLDPTLLLRGKEWSEFYDNEPIIKEPYILCYYMPGNKMVESRISKLACKIKESKGLRVISIGRKEYTRLYLNKNNRVADGPKEFLNLISNASYVLTNSFHGVCFSVNFNKNFFAFVEEDYMSSSSLSSRIFSLLNALELKDRIVVPSGADSQLIAKSSISYSEVQDEIEILRANSIGFLMNAVGN